MLGEQVAPATAVEMLDVAFDEFAVNVIVRAAPIKNQTCLLKMFSWSSLFVIVAGHK